MFECHDVFLEFEVVVAFLLGAVISPMDDDGSNMDERFYSFECVCASSVVNVWLELAQVSPICPNSDAISRVRFSRKCFRCVWLRVP